MQRSHPLLNRLLTLLSGGTSQSLHCTGPVAAMPVDTWRELWVCRERHLPADRANVATGWAHAWRTPQPYGCSAPVAVILCWWRTASSSSPAPHCGNVPSVETYSAPKCTQHRGIRVASVRAQPTTSHVPAPPYVEAFKRAPSGVAPCPLPNQPIT